MEDFLTLTNTTSGKLPSLPFLQIKNKILGKKYLLSIVFISKNKIQVLNKKYRKKNKATNILSFSLSKNEGEIFLCPSLIKEQKAKFKKDFPTLLLFLVIHGMLHLKGMEHSAKMIEEEEKYLNYFLKK